MFSANALLLLEIWEGRSGNGALREERHQRVYAAILWCAYCRGSSREVNPRQVRPWDETALRLVGWFFGREVRTISYIPAISTLCRGLCRRSACIACIARDLSMFFKSEQRELIEAVRLIMNTIQITPSCSVRLRITL